MAQTSQYVPDIPGSFNDDTHHSRNPLQPVQPIQPRVELSQVEKEATYATRKIRKQNDQALEAELNTLLNECDEKIKTLSKKYSTKESKIRDEVYNVSSFKRERQVNTWNAELAYKAKVLRESGEKGGLARARAEVLEERTQRGDLPLSKEKLESMMEYIQQKRSVKQGGARSTNKSAAMDASFTASRIQNEMRKLNSRTGSAGILIMTRGHLNDSIAPTVFESDNASGFCKKALGHSLFDVGTRLESWTILQGQSQVASSTKDLRKKCVTTIIDGLRELTRKGDAAMNYNNYDAAIKSRYKVHLVGWPPHVPFANPSNITTDELQRLSNALQSFECRWERMTRDEITSHNAKQDARMAARGAVGTVRKTRSDKGKKRGLNAGDSGPAKRRQKKSGGARAVASKMPPGDIAFADSDTESNAEQAIPSITSSSTAPIVF